MIEDSISTILPLNSYLDFLFLSLQDKNILILAEEIIRDAYRDRQSKCRDIRWNFVGHFEWHHPVGKAVIW